jgi:radical SAM protein with 4Fe4S-binding SPASM domain
MCPLTKGLSRKQGVLKFENFKRVYDEVRFPYVNLTGLGEPLLNPEIFQIIKYARKRGSMVKLDTNAMLLDDEKIKNLVECDPTFISISIDGVTKKSYEAVRKGANFDTVINNLKKLKEHRDYTKSKMQIHLFFVLQKKNFKDLIKFIELGESLGVDAVNGNIAISFGKANNTQKIKINRKEIEEIKQKLKEIKGRIKTKLNIENIEDFIENPENQKERMSKKPCYYPWYNPCITWDGYVVPCDIHCNNEIVFGNAFEEPFMKIWNNEKAQEFRKNLITERKGICAKCCVDESFLYEKLKLFHSIPLIKSLSYRRIK